MSDNNNMLRAYITKEKKDDLRGISIKIDLLDDGTDADLMATDGIYSKAYADLNDDGRYTLKCKVVGDENTAVNKGFLITKTLTASKVDPDSGTGCRMSRTAWWNPANINLGPPICCGSTTISKMSATPVKTGSFERQAVGGSFKVC